MIISNITLNNVEIPVNDNLIGTSTSLNTSSPSNNDILPTYETIDNIPVITPGTGSVFPDNPALLPKITTLSELLNYLSEVMIRFNSNPKYYMQDDFALLIKTITNSLIYLYTTGGGGSTISTGIPFIGIANLLTNPGNDAIAAGNNFPGIYYAQDTGTYPYFYNTVITVEQRLNSIVLLIPTIVNEICVGYTTSVYNIDVYTKTSDFTNDGEDGVNPFITALDLPDGTKWEDSGLQIIPKSGKHIPASIIDDLPIPISAHNDTTGKQGGTTGEYYHLTNAQVSKVDPALQSFTETDPVFAASAAHEITSEDINNWDGKISTIAHNSTTSLNSGDYQHLTASQLSRVLAGIYLNNISSISVTTPTSPTLGFGERGLSTNVKLTYNINPRDDVFTSALLNNTGSQLVTTEVSTEINLGNKVVSETNTMYLSFTRNTIPTTDNTKSATYNAYVPQWCGASVETDFATYALIETERTAGRFTKSIQSSASILNTVTPISKYIWFISNKTGAIIKDEVSGAPYIVGAWDDGVSEFYYKKITALLLADGTTTSDLYFYRSRQLKTLPSTQYRIY